MRAHTTTESCVRATLSRRGNNLKAYCELPELLSEVGSKRRVHQGGMLKNRGGKLLFNRVQSGPKPPMGLEEFNFGGLKPLEDLWAVILGFIDTG